MSIIERMAKAIDEKTELIEKLHKNLDSLCELELAEKNKRTEILNSDLTKVIDGKITEKAKTAYCDKILQEQVDKIAILKNEIDKTKRLINLCNDKISLYKYMIRELEL